MSILQIMKGWHLLCLSYKMINHYWYLVFWQVPWYFAMWDPHCGYNLTLFPPCLMLSLLRGSFGGHVGASYCITITGSCMGYYARAGSHITYFLLKFLPLSILLSSEIVLKRFSTRWLLPVLFALCYFQLLLLVIIVHISFFCSGRSSYRNDLAIIWLFHSARDTPV